MTVPAGRCGTNCGDLDAPPPRTSPKDHRAQDGPPAELKAIAARVQARLAEILTAERRQWAALDPSLDEALDALRALPNVPAAKDALAEPASWPCATRDAMILGGGKRIRPAYCHWGWLMGGGGPDGDGALDAGCALEILHAFALAHDDVMDASPTRRGRAHRVAQVRAAPPGPGLARRGPALRRGGRGAGGRHGHGARRPHAGESVPRDPGGVGRTAHRAEHGLCSTSTLSARARGSHLRSATAAQTRPDMHLASEIRPLLRAHEEDGPLHGGDRRAVHRGDGHGRSRSRPIHRSTR